jgi:hypothetical protein
MYTDAVKTTGHEGQIEVRDVIQVVAEAMEWDHKSADSMPSAASASP